MREGREGTVHRSEDDRVGGDERREGVMAVIGGRGDGEEVGEWCEGSEKGKGRDGRKRQGTLSLSTGGYYLRQCQ